MFLYLISCDLVRSYTTVGALGVEHNGVALARSSGAPRRLDEDAVLVTTSVKRSVCLSLACGPREAKHPQSKGVGTQFEPCVDSNVSCEP